MPWKIVSTVILLLFAMVFIVDALFFEYLTPFTSSKTMNILFGLVIIFVAIFHWFGGWKRFIK